MLTHSNKSVTQRITAEQTRCDEIARSAPSAREAFSRLQGQDLIFATDSLRRVWRLGNAEVLALINGA